MNHYPKATEIFVGSSMSVAYEYANYLHIEFGGEVSKFPSVTNNRLNMIPRQGALKACRELAANLCRANVENVTAKIKSLRALSIVNPAHQEILTAATMLWRKAKPKGFHTFPSSIDNRLFGVLLCGNTLRQHDTHNITKSMCDWLQSNEIIKNDRHLDVLAVRSSDFTHDMSSTSILIVRQKFAWQSVSNLVNLCVNYEQSSEPIRQVQQNIFS